MTLDEPHGTSGASCAPSDTASRPSTSSLLAAIGRLAALLSLWPRRTRPPSIPEEILRSPYLRRDVGLPPAYDPMTWHDIGRTRPGIGNDLR